jgi:hypothetical protein
MQGKEKAKDMKKVKKGGRNKDGKEGGRKE